MLEIDYKISSWLDRLTDERPAAAWLARFCARPLLPLFLLGALIGHIRTGHPPAAMLLILGAVVGGLISVGLSFVFRRQRPYERLPDGAHLTPRIYTPSFPSDHATIAFATAGSFFVSYDLPVVIVALVIAGVIAISRVVVGVHYLTDVLAGAMMGLLADWFVGTYFL